MTTGRVDLRLRVVRRQLGGGPKAPCSRAAEEGESGAELVAVIERIFREEVVERGCRVAVCSKEGERAAFPFGEFGSVGGAVSSGHVGHATEF